jgi:hypothetical protein
MTNYIYWSKTALTGGGATALDGITGMTAGDFSHTCVSGVLYVHKCITSSATESSPDLITPDAGGSVRWQLQNTYSSLPTGYISGLGMSHDTDTEHDISIAAGRCRDSTDAADIILASAIVKRADASWAVGTTNGGMDTGSIPATGTLHVWLIKRSDTGVVDALFSISATAPTMPANYDYKRRIGAFRTDASANILNGNWWGTANQRVFMYDSPILDQSAAPGDTSAHLITLSVPGGIKTLAYLNHTATNTSITYYSSTDNTDLAPSATVAPLGSSSAFTSQVQVFADTSSQIRYRMIASQTIYVATLGWEEAL